MSLSAKPADCEDRPTTTSVPNIVLIMADDMGYSDIGCYGGEIETPSLDDLASGGLRFSQFYNAGRCCPTRASLMTGLYPHEAGVGHMTGRDAGTPGYRGYLTETSATIAEVLAKAGYHTSMVGKWHAGNIRAAWPENRGFQRFFGTHNYIDSYFKVLPQCDVYEDGRIVIEPTAEPMLATEQGKEWYTTDIFTTKALGYIDEAIKQGKPFFQYVAYNSPHWPLEAHDDVIEKYIGRYADGYEQLRIEKYHRMQAMGLIDADWKLPEPTTPAWDSLSEQEQSETAFRRAIYAAQIDIMDQNVGRIVKHLEEQGALDNTLLLFLSDNGCSAEPETEMFGYQWPKNTRSNYAQWRNGSARNGASQGLAWSCTSNAPFRMHKKFTHEGGISTPLIAHWPRGIQQPGRWDDRPGHLVDIMATCVDLAGAEYPSERDGHSVRSMRGISLRASLEGSQAAHHEAICWEHEGRGAIRMGRWKLVSLTAREQDSWQLYDMRTDRTETTDLADQHPERCREMYAAWTVWAKEAYVTPWPDQKNAKRLPIDK